jgi:hypothetical protein
VSICCLYCGTLKQVSPVYSTRRFCSPRCWQEYNIGPNNVGWRGGKAGEQHAFYISPAWRRVCSAVWRRDKATCQRCGKVHQYGGDDDFHVHHIANWSDFPVLRLVPENTVLLCVPCHAFVHSKSNVHSEFLVVETPATADGVPEFALQAAE